MALLNILENISDILDECQRYSNTNSFEVVDHVLLGLDHCDYLLCHYVSGATEHYDILRQLHQCINQLQVHWYVKLNRIEGGDHNVAGRPKKVVNVELVCLYVLLHSALKLTMLGQWVKVFSKPLSSTHTYILVLENSG